MTEQWTAFKIKLPKGKSKEFAKILAGANGNIIGDDIFAHYGQLGEGIEPFLRHCAKCSTNWFDDYNLSADEALIPYEFVSKKRNALIEFMTIDTDKVEDFIKVLLKVFDMAEI